MSDEKTQSEGSYSRCYQSAIGFLARREHSRFELINKLRRKPFAKNVDLASLCDHLESQNYLCDKRFSTMFVSSRVSKGQGDIKIRYELRQRRVEDSLIDFALLEAEVDWLKLAQKQREKRFSLELPKDFKEREKQYRFLLGRGFSGEIIRQIFN